MRNYGLVLVALTAIGCGSSEKPKGDLTVSGTPTGAVEGQVRMVLAFSRPMVAKEQINQPLKTGPLTLSPDIPREARWADDKTLVVVPTASLPVSTKFTATVPGSTKALDGSTLGKAQSFEFFTERLTGTVEVVGSKLRATRDQIVKLTFNHEVPFDQVTQNCAFSAGSKQHKVKLAPDSNAGPAKSYTIAPTAELAMDTDWVVACKAGLRGTVGNIGIEKAIEDKLHTYGPLKFVSLEPNGDDIVPDEDLRLKIAFTNPLAQPYKLTLEPKVPGFPERCHSLSDTLAGLECPGLLDPRTSYTLTIDAAQTDVFGQKLDKPQTLAFRTTDSKPTISLESGYFVAELKRPVVPVWTRNVTSLDITAVEVTQANFHELSPLIDWWESKPVEFAKTKLKPKAKKLAVAGTKNKWGQQPIDPATLFGGQPGPGMYYLEIGSTEVDRGVFEDGGREKVLVNFTDIGVVSKLSPTRGLVWATKLSTGKPLPGATVTVRDANGRATWTGTTDAEGVAVLPGSGKLSRGQVEEGESAGEMRIYVQHQADWTMVNPTRSSGLAAWNYNVSVDYDQGPTKLRGFMHTDRGLYRPGDTVHVKGIARVTKLGEPLTVPAINKKIEVQIEGPQGKVIEETDAKLSAYGGFWFDVALPGDARLGDYTIRAKLEHGTFTRSFSVEEYRPATFEVTGKAKEPQLVNRGVIHATVAANYLYGAPLRGGNVDVAVHSRPRRVRFDQHEGYDFVDERKYDYYYYQDEESQSLVTEDHVGIDQNGNAILAINISPNDVYADSDLLIRASVKSPANEVISKTFTVPYFRSKRYFGIKTPGWFVDVKKPAKLDIIGVAPDGKVMDGPAKVSVTRRDWNCVWEDWGYRGSYQCKDTEHKIVDKVVQLAGGKAQIEFTPEVGGSYWVVVEGENDKAEAAASARRLYAWGDGGGSWRSSDSLSFDIVADKKEYKAGDTATLILQTDLAQASGLVTIERDGVIEKRLIEVTPTAKHITVPIAANHAPNIYVSVALVQGRMGDGERGKPRMRMGLINLPVRPQDNTLNVSVETDRKDYRPGATVTATVKVTDAAGKPVAAEVSITAADEGVLSLIGYETPNPVPTFYTPWGLGVSTATQLEYIRDIPGPNLERPASGGDALGTLRSRFAATAVWTPGAVTNANGIATVSFQAPDNLTAYRMMAVAADKGYRFGSADKRFTVSKPLQLHQALPRFLNVGDGEVKAGVVVHNETGRDGTATVKLIAGGGVISSGPAERTVQLAKGARVPVLFDLRAIKVGASELLFSVSMGADADAVKLQLPVIHPSPVQTAHVGHGASKDATKLPIAVPADAIDDTTQLVVSVDPDGLAGIEDGLDDLIGYPYGCLEQTTSKVIPMLAVRDLAESLNIDGLSGAKLEGFVKAGITKIARHQTAYGGFSLWPGGEPEAYYTAYALWGLYLAKQAGYTVDQSRIDEALGYLQTDGKTPDTSRPYYSDSGNLGAQAFALYIRAVYGDKAATADATTMAGQAKLPIYGKAYVARALAAGLGAKDPAVAKLVGELATVAADAGKAGKLIDEPDGDDMDYYMSSSLRTTSAVLMALVELDPKNAAIKPLVRAVMKAKRTLPYWDTQENLYSLLALTGYAKSVAGAAPSVAIKLGDKQLLSGTLAGKQRMKVVTVPVSAAGELSIEPKGEVHYNVELKYRKQPTALKGASNGLVVKREYLDEAGKPKTTFTVGDVVVVRVTADLKSDAEHLIVSDPLPAGFEALNTRLATVGTAGIKQTQEWGTYREMKDDRVNFVSEWSSGGSYVYEYSMRAIAPGKFARPPTTAELMYEPETNGQTAFDYLEVRAK